MLFLPHSQGGLLESVFVNDRTWVGAWQIWTKWGCFSGNLEGEQYRNTNGIAGSIITWGMWGSCLFSSTLISPCGLSKRESWGNGANVQREARVQDREGERESAFPVFSFLEAPEVWLHPAFGL